LAYGTIKTSLRAKTIYVLNRRFVVCYARHILWFLLCLMSAMLIDITVISNTHRKLGHWFYKTAKDESLVVSGSLDRKRVTYERAVCGTAFPCKIFQSVQHTSEIDFD